MIAEIGLTVSEATLEYLEHIVKKFNLGTVQKEINKNQISKNA
jgi:hypothetical protein